LLLLLAKVEGTYEGDRKCAFEDWRPAGEAAVFSSIFLLLRSSFVSHLDVEDGFSELKECRRRTFLGAGV
jgi:hypothetical protein